MADLMSEKIVLIGSGGGSGISGATFTTKQSLSVWDVRQAVESRIPAWTLLVPIAFVLLALACDFGE